MCRPSNFKPIFNKDKVRSRKLHIGESCKEFIFFPIVVELTQSKIRCGSYDCFTKVLQSESSA